MKYIYLAISIVASSLFISSIKLEAMELRKTKRKKYSFRTFSQRGQADLRHRRHSQHTKKSNNKRTKKSNNIRWVEKLIQKSLADQFSNISRKSHVPQRQQASCEDQVSKLTSIEKLLHSPSTAFYGPLNTCSGAKFLNLLITQTK